MSITDVLLAIWVGYDLYKMFREYMSSRTINDTYESPFRIDFDKPTIVLDDNGLEVVEFKDGCDEMAREYCKFLNK